jgi:hypothetical protein
LNDGMTELACPVCATPYEAGATTCAFCGVSLLEPEPPAPRPQPAASETDIANEAAIETDATAGIEPAADPAPEPATHAIDETDGIAEIDESAVEAAPVDATEADADERIEAEASAARASDEEADAAAADDDEDIAPAVPPGDGEDVADSAETPENAGIPATAKPSRVRAPSFARAPGAAGLAQRRLRRIEWSAVAGLAAVLLVQVVASDFDQLAAGAATRPWLQRTCNVLRCTLPPWREPQALRMLQRDVHANPRHPGLLRISASFRNDARWAQPWPRLRIVLSDPDGRAIAARDFSASEYLGTGATTNGIASGQVAGIAFDVVDPSPRVTAFTFEFR